MCDEESEDVDAVSEIWSAPDTMIGNNSINHHNTTLPETWTLVVSLTLVTQQQSQKYIFNFRQQTRETQSLNLDFWPLNSSSKHIIIIIGMSITSHIFEQFFDLGEKFEGKCLLTLKNNFGGKWQILTNSLRSADVSENNYISLLQTNISLSAQFSDQ